MLRLVAIAVPAFLLANGASATGTISCASPEGEASLELAVGTVPGLAIVGALIEAHGARWAVNREGTPVTVNQAFAKPDQIWIDFTDQNVIELVAEVRLFKTNEGKDAAMAGTLRIPDVGAWPLVCAGP